MHNLSLSVVVITWPSFIKNLSPLLTQSSSGAYTPLVSNQPSSPTLTYSPPRNSHHLATNSPNHTTTSPNGPLENTSTTPPSSPNLSNLVSYYFANNHTVGCPCCYHNFHLIHSLRDELHIMFSHIEFLIA